jgi:hypothetical protein
MCLCRASGAIIVTSDIFVIVATFLAFRTVRLIALIAIIGTVGALDRIAYLILPATIALEVIGIFGTTLTEPLILNIDRIVNVHPFATFLTTDIIARFGAALIADHRSATILSIVIVVIIATILTMRVVIVSAIVANVFLTTITKHFILAIVMVQFIATTAMKVILGTTLTDRTTGFNVNAIAIHEVVTIGTTLATRNIHINGTNIIDVFFRTNQPAARIDPYMTIPTTLIPQVYLTIGTLPDCR